MNLSLQTGVRGRYSSEDVLIVASLCRPLQDLETVVTILGPDLVGYFYQGVIGREGEVDEFEVLNFIRSRGRGLEAHGVKVI